MLCHRFIALVRSFAVLPLALILSSCGQGDGPPPVADPTLPAAELYTLVWADEFDVDGPPNVENWRMETGYGPNNDGWGNNEWQLYTDDTSSPNNNVRVENGNLIITARCSVAETDPARCNSADPVSGAFRTGIITSARINSKDKIEVKYGNIQARIKTPPGKGMWPAFWMLGSVFPDTPWPRAGEIDIMEMHQFFSNDRTTHFTVHWCDDSVPGPVPCEFDPGWKFDSRFRTFDEPLTAPSPPSEEDYHVYEVDWDEQRIIGKIDGITYFSRPIDPDTEDEFLKRFFLILNIAVGGNLGGPPNDLTWTEPQELWVDWVRVYERNRPVEAELVPQDPTTPLPFIRTVNSVEFGGDSVVADVRSTAVAPLVGDTVVEFDYQSANTFFSGGAFLFRLKDITHYEKLVFSIDKSAFTDLDDISIEIQDDRFTGDGAPGKTILQLSDYMPVPVSEDSNWETYEIPLTDFALTNLDNVALFGFWNPKNSADQLIAGKLYLDDIKFVDVPCTDSGAVNFDADTYPENANLAQITVTDSCLANKNRTVVAVIDNGTESIGVSATLDSTGRGTAVLNFGPTKDATSTIEINAGDVLTATYVDANGANQIDTADITPLPQVATLGVYSETHVDPVLRYTDIINVIDFGGKNTVTDDASTAIPALEGSLVLSADYSRSGPGGNFNGFVFDFGPPLVNGTFEADDASAGNVVGATGWNHFEFVNTTSTIGPNSAPVSHDAGGLQSLLMFGPFTFDSASGAFQADDSIVAGKTYTATVHTMNWTGDPLAPGNLGIFQLSFWDAPGGAGGGGNRLGITELLVDSTDDGTNTFLPVQDGAEVSDWTELSITEVAPIGAVSAEIFLLHIQLNDPAVGGSIYWDDVSLAPVDSNDVSSYEVLRFGLNASAASELRDLEIKLEDGSGGSASVFLSNYTPTPGAVAGWDLYEIPLTDFASANLTDVTFLGFWNASSTVTGSTSVAPTLFDATLYFDDVHFATGDPTPAPVLTGILVNSAIEGVTFQTPTQSGVTNVLGEFQYLAGETVTFSIGGIVLGTVQGAAIITPVELTGGADPIDQTATNQLVFLQTIDADADHTNGITISPATRTAAETQSLLFTDPDFSNQVAAVVAAIQDPADPDQSIVPDATALDNFYLTYVALGGSDTFAWSFPAPYPPFPPLASGDTTTIAALPESVLADGVAASVITVQAKDASGTNLSTSAGEVLLSATGSAVLSTVTDQNDGTYTASVTNTVTETVTISGSIAGIDITDTAIITFTSSSVPETLGVYSETHTDPVLAYSEIIDNDTVTNEASMLITALEGVNSLQADFALPSVGTENGFDFNFGPAGGGGSPNLLLNGGFGLPDATASDVSCHTDWICFNASFTTAADGPNFAPVSHNPEDNQSVKQFGGDGGAFQDVPITVGETYEASVWAMNWIGNGTTDPFGEFAFVELSFRDGAGNLVPGSDSQVFVDPIDDGINTYLPPQDGAETTDWTQLTLSAVAPAGAASARMLLIHQIVGGTGGTIRWDDASIRAASAPVTGADLSTYETLKFGVNTSALSGMSDLEARMVTTTGVASSVFLSNYTPTPGAVAGWDVYEIPLADFNDPAPLDLTDVITLGFWNPSSTVTGATTVAPTLLAGTLYFDDIHFEKPAVAPPAATTIGVYSETNTDPVLAYSEIINAADFGGNSTIPNEFSTAVTPFDGSVVLQALYLNSNQTFGGILFNFDTVRPAVNGQDISGYTTLKFAIDASAISTFADLKVQLEDGTLAPGVFLSSYTPTVSGNWALYDIPLNDFAGLNLTNLTHLGFWNPSSVAGAEAPLVFGPIYFDDIHFQR